MVEFATSLRPPASGIHYHPPLQIIKILDSYVESRLIIVGQEPGPRQTSELFIHSTALKFVNALDKPP